MAWSLEGLGILWLGVQQQQRRMSYSGTALLVWPWAARVGADERHNRTFDDADFCRA